MNHPSTLTATAPDVADLADVPDATAAPIGAPAPRSRAALILLAAGLLLVGLNLRIGVASVGPVLTDIQRSTGLSETVVSLLTTIPVFAFGAFAFFTPTLTRRLGLHRLIGLAMATLAAGILLRMVDNLAALFVGTVLVGAAIAIGNVTMPPAVKQDFSHRVGLMMGLYSTALFVGASLASGATIPLLHAVGDDWRLALGLWAVPAVVALVVWLPQMRRAPRTSAARATHEQVDAALEPPFRAILRDPTALAVTGLMGLQSLSYYAALTWVPTILTDAGMTPTSAGWMLSFSAFPGILASLVTPSLARRAPRTWVPVVVAATLVGVAFAGLAVSASSVPATYLWMTLMGLGQGASISLSLSYIVLRSPDTHHTGHVSTMAQGFGYLLAGLGPLGMGGLHSLTGEWRLPLLVLIALLVVQTAAGVVASRPRHIRARVR